jgi:mannose-6-phosphate isomerase-like protein (cupin superfamily)
MDVASISIPEQVAALEEAWHPRDLVGFNDTALRLVRLEGAFPWHRHDQDELFICWQGAFAIELQGGAAARLQAGDVFVVPRDVDHRPVAEQTAFALQSGTPPHVRAAVDHPV